MPPLAAAEESQGRIIAVSDDAIIDMWRRLAREGVFAEPASAAGLAGLAKEIREGRLDVREQVVVAVITGHGLKDPEAILSHAPQIHVIPAQIDALEELIRRTEND